MRRTRIVCTLGPTSRERDTIMAMVRAGMDVARLNTSHGTLEEHAELVRLVREVAAAERKHTAVLMDLAGPKIRTGHTVDEHPVVLATGDTVTLTSAPVPVTAKVISLSYPRLALDVRRGHPIVIDDGAIELQVVRVVGEELRCRVITGGIMTSNRGAAFPASDLALPSLTSADHAAIVAGVRAGVDYFALSFVGEAADVHAARDAIHACGGKTPLIAKIERRKAVRNIDSIVAASDGVMVARGDLGVELPPEDVPVLQREIIASADRHMVPVITATQMLESMIQAPRPTRAEASDVANAVWDNSDAVMLSGETAAGLFPVQAVAMMDRIVRRAESAIDPVLDAVAIPETGDHSYLIALAARRMIEADDSIRAIACFTGSGYSARLMSKVRPRVPIVGISSSETVCRRLSLLRGVLPCLAGDAEDTDGLLRAVEYSLSSHSLVTRGDAVIIAGALPVGIAQTTNFVKLHRAGELDDR